MSERFARLRPLAPFFAASLALAVMGLAGAGLGLRWNWTASAPIGLWRDTGAHQFRIGDHVLACPPMRMPIIQTSVERGYLPSGRCPGGLAPLLKIVSGVPGSTVQLTLDSVKIDQAAPIAAATLEEDSDHRPLPHMPAGTYRLGIGQYWLLSPANPRSIDSRYFGPINADAILGKVEPLFTVDPYGEATP
jgi:conjugative transfer signal peptidase TraF